MSSDMQVSTTSVLVGQILVMAALLERALGVVKNVEAEGSDEAEQLQELIEQGEEAIATVLREHAMSNPLDGVWSAINDYTKLVSQLAACRVAGLELDRAESQELQAAKLAVDRELVKLRSRSSADFPDHHPV